VAASPVLLGVGWLVFTMAWATLFAPDSLGLVDGLLIARLQVFGGIFCLIASVLVLPRFWRATAPAQRGVLDTGLVLLRVVAAVVAFAALAVGVTTGLNSRAIVKIAFGSDRMSGGQVLLAGRGVAEVRGPLSAGIAQDLADVLRTYPDIRTVVLNSSGGWISEGTLLANLIREGSLATLSSTGCFSACISAFLAGRPRTLAPEARLGFHSASGEGTDPVYIAALTESMGDTLREAGASAPFITRALSTPASGMWYPMTHELLREGLVQELTESGLPPSG
jgi:hypothetical protein